MHERLLGSEIVRVVAGGGGGNIILKEEKLKEVSDN
jgi:hypothetical protein